MTKNNEIRKLFENLLLATEIHSIQRINEVFTDLIRQNKDLSEKAERIILKAICEKYSITYDMLMKGKSKERIVNAKRVAFCVLHIVLNQSSRHIANKVFLMNYHNSVAEAIKSYKNANDKIKSEKDFKDEVDSAIESINQKLKILNQNGN